ncbi:MerR family transcriptional regulator [uncultured Cetobacterium sp.]|uniref:MerR family transcriptional regulator n=1 Tax=uncultured Cetobacterium sp. TaxID=527638 RepID=UPI0025D9971C|nr:MerR family transcriptional regulator [uncultured Cetobacterium sp.]
MKNGYKIGEVAKMFNISNKTLLHYEQIELLKPYYIDKESGYRYYSFLQMAELAFIISLKNSGFTLKEIKKYTESQTAEASIAFLDEKSSEIDIKIKELEKTKKLLLEKKKEFQEIAYSLDKDLSIEVDGPFFGIVKEVPPPYGEPEIIKAYNEVLKSFETLDYNSKKCLGIIDGKSLERGEAHSIKKVGILISEKENGKNNLLFKRREFATLIHKDSYENITKSYEKLLDFIQKSRFKIDGDPIEISNEKIFQFEDGVGWIVKIMIPVNSDIGT